MRTGIALYGLAPSNDDPFKDDLRPAMRLTSYIAGVRHVQPGDSVGYGRRFIAEAPARIGIVPIGYADGIARALTNRGDVLVAGRRCRITGTISMDQLTVRLPEDWGAPGDEVVFFGAARTGAGGAVAGSGGGAGLARLGAPTGSRSAQPQPGDGERILCEEVAQLLGTINYEIVCDVRRASCDATSTRVSSGRRGRPGRGRMAPARPERPGSLGRRGPDWLSHASGAGLPGRRGRRPRRCVRRSPPPSRPASGRGSSAAPCATGCSGARCATSTWPWTAPPRRWAAGSPTASAAPSSPTPSASPPCASSPAACTSTCRRCGGRSGLVCAVRAACRTRRAGADARLAVDLAGRDFTVDAMAEPAAGGEVVDPLGGRDDLAAGRLRLCAPGALDDDALRVLRLARLELELGLVPDDEALAAARRAVARLAAVSGERLRDELTATLGLPRPSGALRRLADLGALAVVLPELDRVRGVTQNPYHHHDVFDHTLEGLDYVHGVVAQLGGARFLATPEEVGLPGAGPLAPVAWALLLHDVGKPVVKREEDGRIMFWHHDEVGRGMTLVVADRLRMSRRFAHFLGLLVRQHLRLGFLVREQPLTRRALARYRRDVSPYVFESVVVSLCDRLATRGDKTSLKSIARHYRLARDVWSGVTKAPVPRLLSGDDVIELLGLEPGPAVGQALDALEEEVEAGEVTDVDGARSFLKAWWSARDAERDEEHDEAPTRPEAL